MTDKLDPVKIEKVVEDTEVFISEINDHMTEFKTMLKVLSSLQEEVHAYGGDWAKLMDEKGYSPEKKEEIVGFMEEFNEANKSLFEAKEKIKEEKVANKKFSKTKSRSFKL